MSSHIQGLLDLTQIPAAIAILLTGLGVGAFVARIFKNGDDSLTDRGRADWSNYLQRIGMPPPNWSEAFTSLFDRVFGKRHLTLRCFFRSCIASAASLSILVWIWATVRPAQVDAMLAFHSSRHIPVAFFVVFLVSLPVTFNFIPDYVSLLETRWILRVVPSTMRKRRIILLLVFDAVLSVLIFLAFFTAYLELVLHYALPEAPKSYFGWKMMLSNWEAMIIQGLTFTGAPPLFMPFGLLLDTTLLTSVWLWVYIFGFGVVRVYTRVSPALIVIKRWLPVETRPIRSIGVMGGAALCLIIWICAAAVRFF